jgi:hypothetical protein
MSQSEKEIKPQRAPWRTQRVMMHCILCGEQNNETQPSFYSSALPPPLSRLHSTRVPLPFRSHPSLWCGSWQELLWYPADAWKSMPGPQYLQWKVGDSCLAGCWGEVALCLLKYNFYKILDHKERKVIKVEAYCQMVV